MTVSLNPGGSVAAELIPAAKASTAKLERMNFDFIRIPVVTIQRLTIRGGPVSRPLRAYRHVSLEHAPGNLNRKNRSSKKTFCIGSGYSIAALARPALHL